MFSQIQQQQQQSEDSFKTPSGWEKLMRALAEVIRASKESRVGGQVGVRVETPESTWTLVLLLVALILIFAVMWRR